MRCRSASTTGSSTSGLRSGEYLNENQRLPGVLIQRVISKSGMHRGSNEMKNGDYGLIPEIERVEM